MNIMIYWFWRLIESLKDYWHYARVFIQRGRRGYADSDLWSFDYYLAKVIGNGIKNLAKISHGYPDKFSTSEEYDAMLNEMSDGFLSYVDEFDALEMEPKEAALASKKLKKSLALFKKNFENLWN